MPERKRLEQKLKKIQWKRPERKPGQLVLNANNLNGNTMNGCVLERKYEKITLMETI